MTPGHTSGDSTGNQPTDYKFGLYITGASHHSIAAVKNFKAFCEQYLPNCYKLDIIDVYRQPTLAQELQIIAVPTLVILCPQPTRRIIGDMSNTQKIISVLGLEGADS